MDVNFEYYKIFEDLKKKMLDFSKKDGIINFA